MAISKTIAALLLAWLPPPPPPPPRAPLPPPPLAPAAGAVSATAQPGPASRPQIAAAGERAADELKNAEDLLQKQQYAQAEEKLLALAPKQNDNAQVWFDLGFAQSRLGDR